MPVTLQMKQIVLKTEWCKGCGICAAFCPKDVLKIEQGKVAFAQKEKCTGCGLCEMRCPDYAIYLQEEAGL